ncbi:hypothetical protein [Luteimonas deserti]|uniref:Uncharacterized protein n=1 Tax=Luteimonas deserti TaxID=2752306 RepID=A0A7Z0QUH3_9GAMM|nr:hypothetical protein [Luteimonas deserti]NYZ64020.1 hypothetical protein [Luteimonas deserti]
MSSIQTLLLAGLVSAVIVGLWHWYRIRRRNEAYARLLDAADAFEARLRVVRAQFDGLAGGDGDPVRDALQEMLRQRLWLQEHGAGASARALDGMRASIAAAQARVDLQLAQLEQARAAAGL